MHKSSPLVGAAEGLWVNRHLRLVLFLAVLAIVVTLPAARQHLSRKARAAESGRQARRDAVRVRGARRRALHSRKKHKTKYRAETAPFDQTRRQR